MSGSIYALNPDIPIGRQRLRILVTGAVAEYRIFLDRRAIGPAGVQALILPGPGAHRLALCDGTGRTVDGILFTIL